MVFVLSNAIALTVGFMYVQEAAWLEQQEALLAMQAAMPVQPIYTRKPAKTQRTPELDDAESQQYSPYPRFSRYITQHS